MSVVLRKMRVTTKNASALFAVHSSCSTPLHYLTRCGPGTGTQNLPFTFGTNVCTTENDNYLNLYADYNLEEGWLDDDLIVVLVRSDGSDIELRYKLSVEEKAAMIPKMDAYCKRRLGLSLDDCREQYFGEQAYGNKEQPTMDMQM